MKSICKNFCNLYLLTQIISVMCQEQSPSANNAEGSSEVDWSSNGGPDSDYNCQKGFCSSKFDDALLPSEEISTLPGQTKLIICDGSKHGETVCKALARPYKAISAKCTCPNNYGNFSKVGVCELVFADQGSWGLCNWPGAYPKNRLILCFMNGQATDPWSLSPYENSTTSD